MIRRSALDAREAVKNVFFKTLSAPLEKACRFLVVLAAAPVFGAAAFGTYQYASTVTALLAFCTEFGLGMWTTRALARDVARAGPILAAGLRARTATAVPYLALLAIVTLVQPSGDARVAIALLGGATLANSFVDYFGAAMRGYEAFRLEAVMNASRALLTTAGAIAGLRFARSVAGLASGVLVGSVAGAVLGIWLLNRQSRSGGHAVPGSRRDHSVSVALTEVVPLWLGGLFSTLYFRCDVVLLQVLAPETEVGTYAAAYRIFEALMLLPAAMTSVAFPRLARTGNGAAPGWTPLERQLTVWLTALGLATAIVLYGASDRLMHFAFGPAFARGAASLRILALAMPVLFADFALTLFLLARGRERAYLGIVILVFAINVAVNLAAIPRWGGPGAAWATLVSEAALAIACLVALGIQATPRRRDSEVVTAKQRGDVN